MQLVILLAACLTVSIADEFASFDLPIGVEIPRDNSLEKPNPEPCCFPKQWQGNITGQAGIAGGMRTMFKDQSNMVFVDQTNKRIAGRATVGCHKNETGGFVLIFGNNNTAQFYAFNMNQQKCFKKDLTRATFRDQCIPKNASYDGDITLGPSSGGLSVQSWSFHGGKRSDRGAFFISGRILVVPNNCIPVYVQDHGMVRRGRPGPHKSDNEIVFDQEDEYDGDSEEDEVDPVDELDRSGRRHHGGRGHHGSGTGFVASVYLSNIEPSIKDPSVFTPPSYCSSADAQQIDMQVVFGEEEPFSDIVDRFVDTA